MKKLFPDISNRLENDLKGKSLMGLFSKKKKENEDLEEGQEAAAPEKKSSGSGEMSLGQLSVQVEKLNASVEAFAEVRKSFSERFSRVSEQIGELRAMILDRDKSIQEVELKAVKAHDLVMTVQPEKMMTSIQKGEAKIEALKANLEGNESIMSRIMEELKDVKKKVEFFRGIEEIVKLSEETKKDLIEIKKVESKISLNTDKVDTIYSEMRKKFQQVDVVDSQLQEMKAVGEQNEHDVQFVKDKIIDLASKDDLEKLITRVQRYVDALKDLEKKSSMGKDIDQLKDILEGLK
jgi:chromosome segregation ATPase